MKITNLFTVSLLSIGFFIACTKNSSPKTIYDTVRVTKFDTIQLPPPNDTPNLSNGLVLYLPFTNGSFADSSGANNTVTAVDGGGLGYDMHGYAQSAFTSDGTGPRLVVSNNGHYDIDTAFSISLDFMIRSTPYFGGIGNPGRMNLISRITTATGNGPSFELGMLVPGMPQNLDWGLDPATNDCNSYGLSPNDMNDTTSWIPQVGSWYNVIVVYSSGVSTIYVNGQMISSKTATFTQVENCPNSEIVIGGWWDSDPATINGAIDEVRVYNRSLTAAQIAWLSRNFQIHSNAQKPGLQQGGKPGLN
jgi:Concanavalin A-like lectin/glucanases superfamily